MQDLFLDLHLGEGAGREGRGEGGRLFECTCQRRYDGGPRQAKFCMHEFRHRKIGSFKKKNTHTHTPACKHVDRQPTHARTHRVGARESVGVHHVRAQALRLEPHDVLLAVGEALHLFCFVGLGFWGEKGCCCFGDRDGRVLVLVLEAGVCCGLVVVCGFGGGGGCVIVLCV